MHAQHAIAMLKLLYWCGVSGIVIRVRKYTAPAKHRGVARSWRDSYIANMNDQYH
jgi:hypothetical protein